MIFILIHALITAAFIGLPLYCAVRLMRAQAGVRASALALMAVCAFYALYAGGLDRAGLAVLFLASSALTLVLSVGLKPNKRLPQLLFFFHLLSAAQGGFGAMLLVEANNIRLLGMSDDTVGAIAGVLVGVSLFAPYVTRARAARTQ